ncbi:UDP-N-acetylmuramoyl-L-alanyl-D-glutamate--2,6-diaminopimelate ligase [Pueribacillus theae]|uniref:UDP-N-acetylmuramoyl-L-alanyl-D-glutamate--2,6-diaminopimelate ligase n=1 Tax=Pueribacillus theae TaxID=2171751 RepID=A0A2U1K7Y7_9BACI|nr:UDP-N-acetylmuramoyl-L-alanyl-D-glutamate--2,6-diaminopimelate ligase [Pueribacillus theae]PWA13405.1 UDP-N-acetylmuramoyl-L-alanyl-D-glutamate--2,6-diaminopimelate ligase [Pueribacillus theae]
MKLEKLIGHLLVKKWLKKGNPEIHSIQMDSRKVNQNDLFICINGFTVDGHDFAKEAVSKGAVALVVERPVNLDVPTILVKDSQRAMAILADVFYEYPTKKLNVIGVTGTNGKTTTTYLIDKILEDSGVRTGRIGTINTKINGVERDIANTTPESLTLQKMFSEMVEGDTKAAVMEVSSHALHLGRVRGCDFDIAVFTNLTQDHLDYHKTMEAYKQAKGILFSQLGNTYSKCQRKVAVLNNDDEASAYYKTITAAEVVTYGIEKEADISAKNIKLSGAGTNFLLCTPFGDIDINMRLIGTFSVYNALAAVSACLASGISLRSIKQSLESMEGVPGRFELIDEGQPYTVLVDYAHTPDSLLNVLKTIKEFAKGKMTVVVGCGGDRDKTKRPIMGEIAMQYADCAIFTSDNPRSEDPEQILHDITANVEGDYLTIVDRREAIYYAVQQAKPDDVILVAGKGHETEQIIGKNIYHFDDREVARDAIKESRL